MFEPWFIYAIISALLFTFYALSARVLLKDKGDPWAFAFIVDTTSIVAIFPFIFSEELRYSFKPIVLFVLLFAPFLYAITDIIFAKARKLVEVSNISIVIQLGIILTLIGGYIFFSEPITFNKIIAIFLIIFGNLIVLWKGQIITLSEGIKLTIIGVFLFASGSFTTKYVLQFYSPALTQVISFSLTAFWIFTFIIRKSGGLKDAAGGIVNELRKQGLSIILTGASFGIAILFLVRGYQVGEVSKVLPVQNASLILTVLAGTLFLKERERVLQKLIATAIVFYGALLLQS